MEEDKLEERIGELEWQIFGMDRLKAKDIEEVEELYKIVKKSYERVEKLKEITESYRKAGLVEKKERWPLNRIWPY